MGFQESEEIVYPVDVPRYSVPAAWMIGAKTRLLDCWEPQIEWNRLGAIEFPYQAYVVVGNVGCSRDGGTVSRRNSVFDAASRCFYYDARIHGGANIAHSIIDSAIAGLVCKHALRSLGLGEDCRLIFPGNTETFVRGVFEILRIPAEYTDSAVEGTQLRTNLDVYARLGLAASILPRHLEELMVVADSPPSQQRLFLARRGSRFVENEAEVVSFLDEYGFKTVYLEDLPLLEQFRCVWQAEQVVAVHGAALALLLLRAASTTPRPLSVVEFFGPGYVVTLYRHMVAALGGKWVGVRGRITPEVVRDLDYCSPNKTSRVMSGRFWRKLTGKLGRKRDDWPRSHQSSGFHVDVDSIREAFRVLEHGGTEPPARLMNSQSMLR